MTERFETNPDQAEQAPLEEIRNREIVSRVAGAVELINAIDMEVFVETYQGTLERVRSNEYCSPEDEDYDPEADREFDLLLQAVETVHSLLCGEISDWRGCDTTYNYAAACEKAAFMYQFTRSVRIQAATEKLLQKIL
ncbi:hypothetical protein F4X86_01380 [Candidatus Saccharibacteria bacterium]|nr:hypothetical protein [Candidatus Saccharibacteria bacterium]